MPARLAGRTRDGIAVHREAIGRERSEAEEVPGAGTADEVFRTGARDGRSGGTMRTRSKWLRRRTNHGKLK